MAVITPAATRVDIDVRLGDTFTLLFPVLDVANAAVSVAGWAAHAQVRHTAGDTLLYEWHTAPTTGQGTATTSSAGVTLLFNGAVSALWTWRRDAQFDLFVYEPDGTPHVLAAGRFRVFVPITQ